MTLLAIIFPSIANGQNQKGEPVDRFMLTLDEQLAEPVVPQKRHKDVAASMRRQAEQLYRMGYTVETMRKGEIVIATIPTDKLFSPNETGLMPSYSDKLLEPFKAYLKTPGRYKIIIAVHTDDTGKPEYLEELSAVRADQVRTWLAAEGCNVSSVYCYPMGPSKPLKENVSRDNRAANRRLEFYIVPDSGLIH